MTGFCDKVGAGEKWIPSGAPWFVNGAFEAMPSGYVPASDSPLEDFVSKFQGIRIVVDAGTRQEQTVILSNVEDLFTAPAAVFADAPPEWNVVSPNTLGTLKPLSAGPHVFDLYWTLSAQHCDGIGAIEDENCLPAGEFGYNLGRPFTVTPGHNS